MIDLASRYQLPDDIAPAGTTIVESDLLDLATGMLLVDGSTQEQLTGETLEAQVLSTDSDIVSTVVCNDEDRPALVNVTNRKQSEVDVSLLGIDRSEVALVLFDTVNIYGVNTREWAPNSNYTYFRDPTEYTFDGEFGYYTRHIASESAVQAYTFPKPRSFTYPVDDNTGRFPGGYSNGVMTSAWESKRAFRYQPGRVTGFTLGVRMSTQSDNEGEIIKWGCRNDYGDGYFFQLEKGTDLYIVRTSPDLGELKVPREEWNGDKLFVGAGRTGWGLDLSRVTMFKIEFSWYGAVGAQFLAYVPDGNGEARWVRLHSISAENRFTVPSLRSAYLRLFTSCRSAAGATQPAFINLYGSSVYIDGGDKGTVTLGTAALEGPKNIGSTPRSLLGLNVKGTINGVLNQKAIYPVSLSAFASTPARFDIIFRSNSCAGVQYGYGLGTAISRGLSSTIAVTKTGSNQLTVVSGTFPDISQELIGSTTYLSGRQVRVTGDQVFSTHVVAISPSLTQITTDRPLPDGLTSIRLSRFNAYAVGNTTITSGVTNGSILHKDNSEYWRIGLWPQAVGTYDSTKAVAWVGSSYPALSFSRDGFVIGEKRVPSSFGCNEISSFSIAIDSGTTSYSINAGGNVLTVSGSTNPWPIAIVAELMDGADISDLTIVEGTDVLTAGSGAIRAIPTFTLSGVSQAIPDGGSDYVAHKFENASDPLSAVVVDTQGFKTITTANRVATVFVGSGETKQFDLSHVFGPDKMFITGVPNTPFNTGGLFVVATARVGSGVASAMLNWEEQ
jgi:hypothetical protein